MANHNNTPAFGRFGKTDNEILNNNLALQAAHEKNEKLERENRELKDKVRKQHDTIKGYETRLKDVCVKLTESEE